MSPPYTTSVREKRDEVSPLIWLSIQTATNFILASLRQSVRNRLKNVKNIKTVHFERKG
jgi:hypothetical protein